MTATGKSNSWKICKRCLVPGSRGSRAGSVRRKERKKEKRKKGKKERKKKEEIRSRHLKPAELFRLSVSRRKEKTKGMRKGRREEGLLCCSRASQEAEKMGRGRDWKGCDTSPSCLNLPCYGWNRVTTGNKVDQRIVLFLPPTLESLNLNMLYRYVA